MPLTQSQTQSEPEPEVLDSEPTPGQFDDVISDNDGTGPRS